MKALARILKNLSTHPTPRSSADLKADLAQVSLETLRAHVETLERDRKAALLGVSADALSSNSRQLEEARLMVERGEALVEVLLGQIADAQQREAAADMEAQEGEARRAATQLRDLYDQFDLIVAQTREKIDAATSAAAILNRWNFTADQHGAPERKIAFTQLALKKPIFAALLR